GENAVVETAPAATTGTYTIQVNDAGGNLGLYTIQIYLNAYLKQGTANLSVDTAQDISSSSYVLGEGNADRLAVVGNLPADVVSTGDVFAAARFYGFYFSASTISDILEINGAGQITKVISVGTDPYLSLSGVELDPVDNLLYAAVTTSFNDGSVSGELL